MIDTAKFRMTVESSVSDSNMKKEEPSVKLKIGFDIQKSRQRGIDILQRSY